MPVNLLDIVNHQRLQVWQSWFGSPDMMGHPEVVTEMEKEELGPLISTEGLEQLQNKYVQSVRVSRPQKLLVFFKIDKLWPVSWWTEAFENPELFGAYY